MSRSGQRRADPVDDAREINKRIRKLERRRPDRVPAVSSSSAGFSANATATGVTITSGVEVTWDEFTWDGLVNCSAPAGALTVSRRGDYSITAYLQFTWSGGGVDGFCRLRTGNDPAPLVAWAPCGYDPTGQRLSVSGLAVTGPMLSSVAFFGQTTSDDVDLTLSIRGYPLERY